DDFAHATSVFDDPEWGRSTSSAMAGRGGTSQRNSAVEHAAPASCASMKPGASCGRIPEKVSVAARARGTAGFPKEVDAVNQYAAVIYAPTANGTALGRLRTQPQITERSPRVAMNSLKSCGAPVRTCPDAANSAWPNIPWATATPENAPVT